MKDTCGPTLPKLLAHYDQESLSWRTSQGTLVSDWATFSGSFPRWGTTRHGELFALATPELATSAPAFSSLPTPTARDCRDHIIERVKHRPEATDTLSRALTILLPTPLTTDWGQAATLTKPDWPRTQLRDIKALLPTPAVNDMGGNKTLEWWDEWAPRQKAADGRPAPHGKSLAIEALRMMLPPVNQSGESTAPLSNDGPTP